MPIRCEQFIIFCRPSGGEFVRGCSQRATVCDDRQPNKPRYYCAAHAPAPVNRERFARARRYQDITTCLHIARKNGNTARAHALEAERQALGVTEADLLFDPLYPRPIPRLFSVLPERSA